MMIEELIKAVCDSDTPRVNLMRLINHCGADLFTRGKARRTVMQHLYESNLSIDEKIERMMLLIGLESCFVHHRLEFQAGIFPHFFVADAVIKTTNETTQDRYLLYFRKLIKEFGSDLSATNLQGVNVTDYVLGQQPLTPGQVLLCNLINQLKSYTTHKKHYHQPGLTTISPHFYLYGLLGMLAFNDFGSNALNWSIAFMYILLALLLAIHQTRVVLRTHPDADNWKRLVMQSLSVRLLGKGTLFEKNFSARAHFIFMIAWHFLTVFSAEQILIDSGALWKIESPLMRYSIKITAALLYTAWNIYFRSTTYYQLDPNQSYSVNSSYFIEKLAINTLLLLWSITHALLLLYPIKCVWLGGDKHKPFDLSERADCGFMLFVMASFWNSIATAPHSYEALRIKSAMRNFLMPPSEENSAIPSYSPNHQHRN